MKISKVEAEKLYNYLKQLGVVPIKGFGKLNISITFQKDELVHIKRKIEIELEEDIKPE